MPELIEVEAYREAGERCVGRTIGSVALAGGYGRALDQRSLGDAVVGARILAMSRRGKLAWAELDGGLRLGMRFGMTGRLLVDGRGPIERLRYGPDATEGTDPWERFALRFEGGGSLTISDPRRFGSVELEPDVDALGPDAATLTAAQLRVALATRSNVKAALLDQRRVAGLGNLLVDEILWRAGRRPDTAAADLAPQAAALARVVRSTIGDLSRRGGSHRGEHVEHREPGSSCPRDGAALQRSVVGGRTTYWCPVHQH